MTTSPKTPMLSELSAMQGTDHLSSSTLAYLAERQRNNLYDKIVSEFQKRKKSEGLTKAKIARRMNKTPDVVSRLLGTPGNWTLDTVSSLAVAIGCAELSFGFSPLLDRHPRNQREPYWLNPIPVTSSVIAGSDLLSASTSAVSTASTSVNFTFPIPTIEVINDGTKTPIKATPAYPV